MGTVSLTGSLVATSQMAGTMGCAGGSAALTPFNFALAQANKSYANATGCLTRNVVSPTDYVVLSAIGEGRDVPTADVFGITAPGPITLRLTFVDDTEAVIPVFGPFILQTPPNNAIKLAEVMGNTLLQYFASGN